MAEAARIPDVTVVVPVRDEQATIRGCIQALADQDLPLDRVEVLVVDGGSQDSTVAVARARLDDAPFSRAEVVRAEGDGSRPANLNAGLARARGRLLCRVDARSRLPAHYLRRCRDILDARADVSVVGGRQRATAAGPGVMGEGIARALNNRWTMGMSRYRRASPSGPSDTVYLGAFRTAQVRDAGGWRIDLPINEDYELNRRMSRLGTVWFDANLIVDYVPRDSVVALLRQYAGFGRGKVRYWRLTGDRPQPRQVALTLVPAVALVAAGVALARASPRGRMALLLVGAVLATAIETAGAESPSVSPATHLAGLTATACVAGGWVAGVWSELLVPMMSGTPQRRSRHSQDGASLVA